MKRCSTLQKARMLKRMLAIRRFEERVKELYRSGEISGAIHLYIGQEAIAVGGMRNTADQRLCGQYAPPPRPLHRKGL